MSDRLYLNLAPLTAEEIYEYQINMQQLPTQTIAAMGRELADQLRNLSMQNRLFGGHEHPDLTRVRVIQSELRRRGGPWPTPETVRVIGWPGVSTYTPRPRVERMRSDVAIESPPEPPETTEGDILSALYESARLNAWSIAVGSFVGFTGATLTKRDALAGGVIGGVVGYLWAEYGNSLEDNQ